MIYKTKIFNRNIFIGVVSLVIIFAATLFFMNNEVSKPDLVIGYNPGSFSNSPIIIGKELGLFEKQGLKVEYIPFSSAKYSSQALVTKKINIATGSFNSYVRSISNGADVRFLAPTVTAPTYIYVRPNEITKLVELNNSAVAAKIDSTSGYALKRILKEENISIEFDFEDIDTAYAPIALMNKKIVIAAARGGEDREFIKAGAVVLKEWEDKGYLKRYFIGSSVIIDNYFLENNLEVVDKFLDGYIESQRFMSDNPNETYKVLADFMNKENDGAFVYTDEMVKYELDISNFSLWINPEEILDIARYEKELGIIDKNLSLSELYDNRFEEKLKTAHIELYETKN